MLKFKRLCSVLLIVTLLLSSVSVLFVSAQETTELTADDVQFTENIVSTDDEIVVAPDATDDEIDNGGDLPSSVDNSLSPYFPEVCGSTHHSDQKAIESALFATIYYQFTFEMNKLRGVESTFENTFSPIFAYHIVNKGITDESALEETYNFLKNIGCATNATYPYEELQWDSYDLWPGYEKIWREALRYRMESSHDLAEIGDDNTQITSPDDEDLIEIKTNLNNGKLITFNTNAYGWNFNNTIKAHENAPENEKFKGEKIVSESSDYLDSLTWVLVGYNDDIWCDINNNNVVDSGEMGAFKAVNTWGKNYSNYYNDGFCWIAYDALNKNSFVDGTKETPDRTKAITSMKTINVKAPDYGKDIYVRITLDYGVRSQFAVKFTAEKNGTKYEGRFLPGVNYLVEGDEYRFNNETFIYSLKDLVPGLNNENFDEYDFEVTIEDYKKDNYSLRAYFDLVNEFNETDCELHEDEIVVEESSETIKVCDNTIIYYIGYDNPVLYYKTDDGDFKEAVMKESLAKRGYLYRYYIQDASEAVLYFTDGKGKIDNNNGEYYKATTGFNFYTTEGQREPLQVLDAGFANGLPDIDTVIDEEELNTRNYKNTRYYVDFSGGYGPYYYRVNYENLDTGAVSDNNFWNTLDLFDKSWRSEGNYKITIEVQDWTGAIASKSIFVEVKDRPYEISSVTPDKEKCYLSESIEFKINTNYMNIGAGRLGKHEVPKSDIVIKDSDGNIVWQKYSVECDEHSYWDMTSTTYITYKPKKAGEYTLTVSSTDVCGEYAEKTITFVVLDMIKGDADGNGKVDVRDATVIQKYIAGLATEDELYIKMADCDGEAEITIKDATIIQKYLAALDDGDGIGKKIDYIPPTYTVKFDNTLGWDNVYCEMLSPDPELCSGWPGVLMTVCGVNEHGETVYSVEVPEGVTVVSFNNNGVEETLRIDFNNKDTNYYGIRNEGITLHKVAEK